MAERVRHIGPIVEIKSSETGVLMTTTETIVREEPFLDADHAKSETKGRANKKALKFLGGFVGSMASIVFAYSGAVGLYNDLIDNHPENNIRDAGIIFLGVVGFYDGTKYAVKNGNEADIADDQAKKAKKLAETPQRTGGMEN